MTEHERDLWIKVAEALGLEYWPMLACLRDYDESTPFAEVKMMSLLHGMACIHCTGFVTASGHPDIWFYSCKAESGSKESHPAALLAMLNAHAEATP